MYPTTKDSVISTPMLVLAIIVVILGISLIAVWQVKSSVPSNAATVTGNPVAAAPKTSSFPGFSGFDTLVDDGVTDDQLTGLKYAFSRYTNNLPTKVRQVAIDKSTIVAVPRDRNSTSLINIIRFSVNLDTTPYDAEVDYSSLSPVQLKLFDPASGATIFDSGVIDINTQTPAD
jgi:hypothetical protein